MPKISIVAFLSGILLFATIQSGIADTSDTTELVMHEGASLTATTSLGKITVTAGEGLARIYEWLQDCSLSADMTARQERWYGSRGIYDAAGSYFILSSTLPWWFSCHGISRTVVEEGRIHFASVAEAESWISRYAKINSAAWSNNGLLVSWALVPERQQLNADVWQICILGKKPVALSGAKDDAFIVSSKDESRSPLYDCNPVTEAVMQDTKRVWEDSFQTQ